MEKIKIFEMFAGYGGASHALKKAGIPFECVGTSEIDRYAMQCYTQNHEGYHYGDCTKIDPNELPDFDLLTGGFPCQSFSVAGKGLGELDTRGTLFNEIIRIAEIKKPRYMLLENVKGLTNKNHKATFEKILSELDRVGYSVDWKVLNSKEHGIPQNRERVWFVCFRKDIGNNFEFPQKEELKILLKDILEDEFDEKYYLKQEQVERLLATIKDKNDNYFISGKVYGNGDCGNANRLFKPEGISQSIQSSTRTKVIKIGNVHPSGKGMNGEVYGGNISPAITTNKGEGHKIIQVGMIPKEIINDNERQRRLYSSEGISPSILNRSDSPKIIQLPRGTNKGGEKAKNGISPSITGSYWHQNNLLNNNFRIRKLTPKECFRLMGFLDDEINLEGISNSQQYKLAGNGWDINLVSKIFKQMFKGA